MKDKNNLSEKTVNELILMVRNGNQAASEELLGRYNTRLITPMVSRFSEKNDSEKNAVDDIKQELTVVFFKAVNTYNVDQNAVTFGLYAKQCLSNALTSQWRKLKRRKEIMIEIPFDELIVAEMGSKSPEQSVIENESHNELHGKIYAALSSYEQKVLRMYLDGCSAKEIGSALDKNEKSINNAIFRIRGKVKEIIKK